MEKIPIQKDILGKAMTKILNDAKVPMRIHLQVVKELHKSMKEHKDEIKKHQEILSRDDSNRKFHEKQISKHNEQIDGYEKEIKRHKTLIKGEKGDTGEPGKDGYIPKKGIDYFDGKKGDKGDTGEKGKDAKLDTKSLFKEFADYIKKNQILDVDHVKGLKDYIGNRAKGAVKEGFTKDGIKYGFEELMHGGGGTGVVTYSVDLSSQCNGSNKVFTIPSFSTIILLTGTDAPNTYKNTVDYSVTDTILTMTSAVNAPSSGATLILLYSL